jgi:hypothetical protein
MSERSLYRTPGSRRQRASVRHRQSPRRHFRSGRRAAAVRATTGARLYLDGKAPSLAAAAEACGSNIHYVRAAVDLLQADDPTLLNMVMAGRVSLIGAADQRRQRRKVEGITVSTAVACWRTWTREQRAEFGRGCGISDLWDCSISPVISEDRAQVAAE